MSVRRPDRTGLDTSPSSKVIKYTATNYTDLTTTVAPTANEGDIAVVYNSQGVWLINRRLKGVYIYQSGVWEYGNQEIQDRLSAKVDSVSGQFVDNSDPLNPVVTNPYYKSEKSTTSRPGQTTVGLINQQANTYENYQTLAVDPETTDNYVISSGFVWSYNDGGQDFLYRLRVMQGAVVVDEFFNPEIAMEPQDTGGPGIVLNVISGGSVIGSANTSTNQRYTECPQFNTTLTGGQSYTIELDWTSSSANDEAAIYQAELTCEQIPKTP